MSYYKDFKLRQLGFTAHAIIVAKSAYSLYALYIYWPLLSLLTPQWLLVMVTMVQMILVGNSLLCMTWPSFLHSRFRRAHLIPFYAVTAIYTWVTVIAFTYDYSFEMYYFVVLALAIGLAFGTEENGLAALTQPYKYEPVPVEIPV